MVDNEIERSRVKDSNFISYVKSSRELLLAFIIIVTFILLSLFLPNFFSKSNLLSTLMGISLSTLIVIGATVVMVSGMIDLSVDSIVESAGYAEQAFSMCEEVGNPYIKMMLDTFHMNIEEKKLGGAIRLSGRHLIHFHACCNDRGIPGAGHIPWDEVVEPLKEVHYEGYGVIESLDMGEVRAQTMIWRPFAPTLDDIAIEDLKFLRKKFL
jgi:hypothetical protein